MQRSLTPTHKLLMAMANPSAGSAEIQNAYAPDHVDWEEFHDLCLGHRLLPLVHHHLESNPGIVVPTFFRDAAGKSYLSNIARAEFLSARLEEISTRFRHEGLRFLPWKGPSLAKTIYDDAALRPMDDLDFLMPRDDISRAVALFKSQGFRLQVDMTDSTLRRYISAGHECILQNKERGLYLELSPNPIPPLFRYKTNLGETWNQESQSLSQEKMFLLLCMHGTKHLWSRMIWISDLCAFVSSFPKLDWDKIIELATRARAQRVLAVAAAMMHACGYPTRKPSAREVEQQAEALLSLSLQQTRLTAWSETRHLMSLYDTRRDAYAHLLLWLLAPTFSDWAAIDAEWMPQWVYWLVRPWRIALSSVTSRLP